MSARRDDLRRHRWGLFLLPTIALAAYLGIASAPHLWTAVLRPIFPTETRLLYERASMPVLIGQHLALVGLAALLSTALGMALGIFVTRPAGRDFFDVVSDTANFAQTFPPIAVLALSIPLLGIGFKPTVFALTVYGILPVLRNTITGIRAIPVTITESAQAMGMHPAQILWQVELPVAAHIILAGVRVSVIVAVATATIGATINAGGLGGPVLSGLANQDPAVTLQGGLLAAGLALILDGYLSAAEKAFFRPEIRVAA